MSDDVPETFEVNGLHLQKRQDFREMWNLKEGVNGRVIGTRKQEAWEQLGVVFPTPSKPERFGPKGISEAETREWAGRSTYGLHPQQCYPVRACREVVVAWDIDDRRRAR